MLDHWPRGKIKTIERLQHELNDTKNPVTRSVLRNIIANKMEREIICVDSALVVLSNLVGFSRSVACARVITAELDKVSVTNKIWAQILNNNYAQAGLYWCKVFGTDSEPSHWKSLLTDHKDFKETMLGATGFSGDEFDLYWESMTLLRNKKLAHDDPSHRGFFPDLNPAITILRELHLQIRKKLSEYEAVRGELVIVDILDFDQFIKNVNEDASNTLSVAISSTNKIEAHN